MTRAAAWWATMDGPPSAGPFARCAGEGKWAPGSCRCDGCVVGRECAVAAAVSWRRSPGLLGLALLWRNSSVPPGALPATACHRHHCCGKVFIQQFPRELGTWGECSRSSGRAGRWLWPRCHVLGTGGAETPGSMAGLSPSCPRPLSLLPGCLGHVAGRCGDEPLASARFVLPPSPG